MITLNFLCGISRPPNLPTVRNLTLTFSGDFHVMQAKEEDMIQFKAFFFFFNEKSYFATETVYLECVHRICLPRT